jgi:hypothetical protein
VKKKALELFRVRQPVHHPRRNADRARHRSVEIGVPLALGFFLLKRIERGENVYRYRFDVAV